MNPTHKSCMGQKINAYGIAQIKKIMQFSYGLNYVRDESNFT